MTEQAAVIAEYGIGELSNHDLVTTLAHLREAYERVKESLLRVEFKIIQRCERQGARAIADEDYECTLKYPAPTIRPDLLATLKELIPPEVYATGYTPEYVQQVTVPEKWDLRVVNGWVKYGTEIGQVIERAKVQGRPRVEIKRRKA